MGLGRPAGPGVGLPGAPDTGTSDGCFGCAGGAATIGELLALCTAAGSEGVVDGAVPLAGAAVGAAFGGAPPGAGLGPPSLGGAPKLIVWGLPNGLRLTAPPLASSEAPAGAAAGGANDEVLGAAGAGAEAGVGVGAAVFGVAAGASVVVGGGFFGAAPVSVAGGAPAGRVGPPPPAPGGIGPGPFDALGTIIDIGLFLGPASTPPAAAATGGVGCGAAAAVAGAG
jgi:hypothetical protein